MKPRVTVITLGVPDLEEARRFYVQGLGWTPVMDAPSVVFIQVGHGLLLALFGPDDLAGDVGTGDAPRGPGSFTLAHNVGDENEVREATARFEAAGGTVLKAPQRAEWGGYHSYAADPAGFVWEIAHNAGLSVDSEGTVSMGPA